MEENPTQPESESSPQDQNLEAQLDHLLGEIQEVEAQAIPEDLRNEKPQEPAGPEPVEVVPEHVDPVGADASPGESTEPSLDADTISSMASDLLSAQIDSTIEAVSTPVAQPEPMPVPIDSGPEPEPIKTLSEDELSNQIENLLNDVKAQETAADTPASADSEADIETAVPTEVVADIDTASQDLDADAGAVSIDQIDAMLAESAAQAIEHGPDPGTDIPPGTDEVLAAQAKAEEEAEARAKADRDAAEPMPVPVAATPPESEAANATEPEPVPVPAEVDATEPEPVAAEPMPSPTESVGASAADVANELDNDTPVTADSNEDLAEAALAEPFRGEELESGFEDEQVVINRSGLKMAEHALLMVCSKINKPVNKLSPEFRDSIGWVALGTTGFGLFMMLYGVLF